MALFAFFLGKFGLADRFLTLWGRNALGLPFSILAGFLSLIPSLALLPMFFPVLPCVVAFNQRTNLVAVVVEVLAFTDADGVFQCVTAVKANVSAPDC